MSRSRTRYATLVLVGSLVVAALAAAALSVSPRYDFARRDRAVRRGLDFVYHSIACKPANMYDYGHDLLEAFYNIAVTSADPELSRTAWRMGHERALEFRRIFPGVPPNSDAGDVQALILGDDIATRLGVPDPRLHAQLGPAIARLSVRQHLDFDPRTEPPPAKKRYDVYQDALIATYNAGHAGFSLGASYADVLRWLPTLRPYPPRLAHNDDDYYGGVYTATHVVYTVNHYSQFRVSPDCLPEEFSLLKANLPVAIAERDPETMGEYLDSLRAFGLTLNDPLIRRGVDYLLSSQNADGSWGALDADVYGRYHPTWTAIDGLRDYRWKGIVPCPVDGRGALQ